MKTLSFVSGDNKRFAYTDRFENYLSLHSDSSDLSDGFVSLNGVLLHDFALCGIGKISSRFENTKTIAAPEGVRFIFDAGSKNETSFSVSVLYDTSSLCFTIQPTDTCNSFFILPACSFKKHTMYVKDTVCIFQTDSGLTLSCRTPFSVRMPEKNEKAALKEQFGEKALYAVCITVSPEFHTLPIDIYAVFSEKDTKMLSQSIEKAQNVVQKNALAVHKERVDSFLHKVSFTVVQEDTEVQDIYNTALLWAQYSGWNLVSGCQERGIWAGLPWFRDNWGRDTFIALSGILLTSGCFAEAKNVIESFALHQEKDPHSPNWGRIPNRYRGGTDIIFNTADGTLWFIREVWEYAQYSGDIEFIKKMFPVISLALEADRALRVDDAGFLLHGDADTWMDARLNGKQPFSPRGDKAIDIQALWYTALCIGIRCAQIAGETDYIAAWSEAAQIVKKHIRMYFWNADKKKAADCILPCMSSDNTSFEFVPLSKKFNTKEYNADYSVRPNQLFTIQVPDAIDDAIFDDETEERILQNAVDELVLPYGILSLSAKDVYFHPYHSGCPSYHKDPAYHNGTIWGWNAGALITSLCRFGKHNFAWKLTKELARQIVQDGCIGSMSETLDAVKTAEGSIVCSGAWSQAWSVSEFARTAFQEYLGFKPRLLENTIRFSPRLPCEWTEGSASPLFAEGAHFSVSWKYEKRICTYTVCHTYSIPLRIAADFACAKGIIAASFLLSPETKVDRKSVV